MAKYVHFNSNSLPPLNDSTGGGMFSRIMSAGSNVSSNTMLIIVGISLLIGVAVFYYYYYVSPNKSTYHANSEHLSSDADAKHTAELMFFYADWCPHCKAAKPIWNDLKVEYENKVVNGYKIIFTDMDCSEESSEVEKLMNQYNIEGYPTIKLIKDGQVIEYDAKPSKETLTKFLNTVL